MQEGFKINSGIIIDFYIVMFICSLDIYLYICKGVCIENKDGKSKISTRVELQKTCELIHFVSKV